MDVRAAFYWDVKSNSISYLITTNSLQDGLDIYSSPEQFKINSKASVARVKQRATRDF